MAHSGVPRVEADEVAAPRIVRRMTLTRAAVGGAIFALVVPNTEEVALSFPLSETVNVSPSVFTSRPLGT